MRRSLQTGSQMDVAQLIRPNILNLEPYHCAREKVQEGILLDANENPYPRRWEGVSLNRYPDPQQRKLRSAIAAHVGVKTENVVGGVGSDEILDWIFKLFCQPERDRVAIAQPTYGMYHITAEVHGNLVFDFFLDERFDFDADRFLEVVPNDTKVLFLCSPNNPTGNLISRDQILKACEEWGKIVVVDEAYIEFSREQSLVAELSDHPNLIILRTFSKALGRAALRLGYAVASPEIIFHFLKVKAPYNLSALTMESGVRALVGWQEQSHVKEIRSERKKLGKRLRSMSRVEVVFSSQANFLLFRCPNASTICDVLLRKGIVVRDRSSLPGLQNCIRVTVGTPYENGLFLAELEKVL